MIKKRNFMLVCVTASLVAMYLSGCGRTKSSQSKVLQDNAASQLELILSEEEPGNVRPAPGNQIRVLLENGYGRGLLERVDGSHALFSFQPESRRISLWNGRALSGRLCSRVA